MKRARTYVEMRFAAQLEPCPTCGTTVAGEFEIRRGADSVWCSWKCPQCGTLRTLEFGIGSKPDLAPPAVRFELGPGASELISPQAFLDELTKMAARIPADPATLAGTAWDAAFDAAIRATTCATELLKMLPAGSDRIVGTSDVRLTRSWLERERDRLRAAVDGFVADRERRKANAVEPPPPTGTIDRAALEAHEAWLRRGGTGDGRIVSRNLHSAGVRYGSIVITSADIADSDFTDAYLELARLDKTVLTRCTFERADLAGSSVAEAVITGGNWKRARLAALLLMGARVTETDFSHSDLERSLWTDARVSGAIFDGARFGNGRFDRAVFERCRFRDASFAKLLDTPEPTSTDAQFIDCDFSGTDWTARNLKNTTFVRCTFKGARGKPVATDGLTVRDCDVELSALIAQLH